MALIVNLFGGPGAGKSTLAAHVFALLKEKGINCELVREYAKDKVWEENKTVFRNQAYIFGKQYYRQQYVAEHVDVVITDSPLLLSILYNADPVLGEDFDRVVLNVFNSFNNLNIMVERVKKYNSAGRYQDEAGAKELDTATDNMLEAKGISYISLPGDSDSAKHIVYLVLNKLNEAKPKLTI